MNYSSIWIRLRTAVLILGPALLGAYGLLVAILRFRVPIVSDGDIAGQLMILLIVVYAELRLTYMLLARKNYTAGRTRPPMMFSILIGASFF